MCHIYCDSRYPVVSGRAGDDDVAIDGAVVSLCGERTVEPTVLAVGEEIYLAVMRADQ